MKLAAHAYIVRRFLCEGSALMAGLLGILALWSWCADVWDLFTTNPKHVPMAPSTALMLLLAAMAVLWGNRRPVGGAGPRFGYGAMVVVASVGLLVCVRSWLGWGSPLEQWLSRTTQTVGSIPLGWMSPLTGAAFLVTAISFLLLSPLRRERRTARRISRLLAVAVLLVCVGAGVSYTTEKPWLYNGSTVPMALWTAVSFVFLSLALLAAGGATSTAGRVLGAESASFPARAAGRSGWPPLIVSALLALVVAIIGALYLRYEQGAARSAARNELEAIADLKLTQIANWRRERKNNARFFCQETSVARTVQSLFEGPNSVQARADVLNWLMLLKASGYYEEAALFDTNLGMRLAVPEQTVPPPEVLRELLVSSLRTGQVVMSDLHRGVAVNDIHIDMVFPIFEPVSPGTSGPEASIPDHRRPVGVVALRMDPNRFLYPLIQTWPIPSRTAETLLVRREGNEVVFLNELRHRKDSALNLRLPIESHPRLPAAMAASGLEGPVEGLDYRGTPVLAVVRSVPRSPWFMVAKVDRDEIYAPIRKQAWLMLLLTVVLAAMVGLAVRLFWQRREESFFEQELAAERKREALAARIVLLMKQANDIILLLDQGWRIIEANERAIEAYGYSEDELHGMALSDLRDPVTRDAFDEEMGQIDLQQGIVLETVHQRKDGTTFPVESSIRTAEVEGRRFHQLILRDTTERKRGEKKLHQQLSRMDLLNRITRSIAERQDLDSVFGVVLRHLEDQLPIDFGCICFYDSFSRTFVVAASSSKPGTLVAELDMGPRAVVPVDQNGLGACVRGQTVYDPDTAQVEAPFLKKLARGGLHSVAAMPLMVNDKVTGVLMAARCAKDAFSSGECEFLRLLSEHVALAVNQMELHESLQKAYDDLRRTQQAAMQHERLRAMGQMASGIAHDINNALGPISLYAESLLENEPDLSERARRQLQTIQSASDDIAETVARMREFYSKREELKVLMPVELNALARQVIDLTRPRWKDIPQERGAAIEVQLDLQDNLPVVMGFESEIRGALTNLVFNALDAISEGGRLTVRTRLDEDRIFLEVMDNGVGMDEEVQQQCLEPFFTTKGERGTGLGLAMVYGVVQRHEAEIAIESRPGEGTAVRLVFPNRSTVRPGSDESVAVSRTVNALHILYIDDDPLMRRSLQEALETEGHRVCAAETGQAGLDAFRGCSESGEPFHVVITDLGMPHMDGREVARAVKSESPATPVILLTGWGIHLNAEHEKPAYVDRVLSKPAKIKELRGILEELTGRSQERDGSRYI